jgi:hypothetical protein
MSWRNGFTPPRGSIMPFAKFEEIKAQFDIHDERLYFYAKDTDGTLMLRQVSEYELLAEEGLKAAYDEEPDGLWEKCLEG